MSDILRRLKHELLGLIPTAVYFLIAFQLLALTQALALRQYGIEVSTFLVAAIGAVIAAKVVMIADLLPFMDRFKARPLIYNVVWKSAIYTAVALLVRYLERLVHALREHESFAAANRHLGNEVVWPHFWIVQIWLVVLFLVYCTFKELTRSFGRERMRNALLGPVETDAVRRPAH